MTFIIRRANYDDKTEWLRMRHGLWPEAPLEYLASDLDRLLADDNAAVFMAFNVHGQTVGFIEARLRAYAIPYQEGANWRVKIKARGRSGIDAPDLPNMKPINLTISPPP